VRWSLESVRQRQGDWVLTALTVLLLLMMFVFAPLQGPALFLRRGSVCWSESS